MEGHMADVASDVSPCKPETREVTDLLVPQFVYVWWGRLLVSLYKLFIKCLYMES